MKVRIEEFMNDMGIESFEDIGFLYQDYITECNGIVEAINQQIDTHTPDQIEALVHNFKGVSANLYVTSVFEETRVLNDLLKTEASQTKVSQETRQHWTSVFDTYCQAKKDIIDFFAKEQVSITD